MKYDNALNCKMGQEYPEARPDGQIKTLTDIANGRTAEEEEFEFAINVVSEYLDYLREATTVRDRCGALEEIKCYAENVVLQADEALSQLDVFAEEPDDIPLDAWKPAASAEPAHNGDDVGNNE